MTIDLKNPISRSSTMKVNLFIFGLFCSIYLQAQTLRHAELLGRPTDKSITVKAFFNNPAEVCIQYGTSTGVYPQQTAWKSFAAGEPAEILVDGLSANTAYFYRMCYRAPGSTIVTTRAEHKFQTQRTLGSTFTFVVQADPHLDEQSDTAIYRRCLNNQLDDAPDFMVDLGDFLMSDKLKNAAGRLTHDTVTARCHLLRSYYETSGHSVPLFISLGNHEGESGWNLNNTPENVAIWGTLDRQKYFLNPAPNGFYTGDETVHPLVGKRENYYAWTWGDALFIVLDPYWYTSPKPDAKNGWRWTLGKTQYDWLKNTLEKSKAKFKFVFAHQIVGGDPDGRGGTEFADFYEWGGKNLDGTAGFAANRPGWYKPIKDLLTENQVNIFFHGHDHFFGKQEKDCLIYQETPQPSHPNFQSTSLPGDYGYFTGQFLPNSGHIRVTVGPEGVKVEYVRVYAPKSETATRKNKDVSASYVIPVKNCYSSTTTAVPMLWNSNYADELVYPNPFKTEAIIEFSLGEAERLTLSILNEQGQVVRHLMNGTLVSAGKFQVIWDGQNDSGNALPSGMYWYRISGANGGQKTGKIIHQN